jgi:hypothetical protein
MKLFLLKSVCLLSVLYCFVEAGFHTADLGISNIKGDAYMTGQNRLFRHEGDTQPSIDGRSISHDLSAKQKMLEEMNNFNVFTFMGKQLTLSISKTAEKIISLITDS